MGSLSNHLAQRLGRARRPDGDLEAELFQIVHRRNDKSSHITSTGFDGVARNRSAGKEAIRQPQVTDAQAARPQRATGLADQELGAAAADVDEKDLLIEYG